MSDEIKEKSIESNSQEQIKAAKEKKYYQSLSYEQAIKDLEKQVGILEAGEVSLDEAMSAFVKGCELAKQCQTKLDEAERQMKKMVQHSDGTEEEVDLDEQEYPFEI